MIDWTLFRALSQLDNYFWTQATEDFSFFPERICKLERENCKLAKKIFWASSEQKVIPLQKILADGNWLDKPIFNGHSIFEMFR